MDRRLLRRLARGIDQGEIARRRGRREPGLVGVEEESLERNGDAFGEADAFEAPVATVSPVQSSRAACSVLTILPRWVARGIWEIG